MKPFALFLALLCAGCSTAMTAGTEPETDSGALPFSPNANASNASTSKAVFIVRIPHSQNRKWPRYISPSTEKLFFRLVSVNGLAIDTFGSVSVGSSNCTNLVTTNGHSVPSPNTTCTVTISLPGGADVLEILAGTTAPSNARELEALSISPRFNIQITEGQTTQATPTSLSGIAANLSLIPAASYTTTSRILKLNLQDQGANLITGSTSIINPVTLTDSDSSGATGLSVNGSAPAQHVTVSTPADIITLTDNGTAAEPTIQAHAQLYNAQSDFPVSLLGYSAYYTDGNLSSSFKLYCAAQGCEGDGSGTFPIDVKVPKTR